MMALEDEVLALGLVPHSKVTTSESVSSIRKRAGLLLADYSKRTGLTNEIYRVANCCRELDEATGNTVGLQQVRKALETLTNDAQSDVKDSHRLEGLQYAAFSGNETGIQFFCLSGSDVNHPSSSEGKHKGFQPAHLAVEGCQEKTLLRLLQLGADLAGRTSKGLTCLHIATIEACAKTREEEKTRALDLLRLVLQKSAMSITGLSPEDDLGSTPLDNATALENEEVVKILEDAGARRNTRREVS
jgi:hypothetical protein